MAVELTIDLSDRDLVAGNLLRDARALIKEAQWVAHEDGGDVCPWCLVGPREYLGSEPTDKSHASTCPAALFMNWERR